MQPHEAANSAAPVEHDARCRRCEYNLRGLAGDPVICPECGAANDLAELLDRASERRRWHELRGAGDGLVLASLALAGGVMLMLWRRDPTFGAIVGGVGLLLGYQAISTCRRILPDAADWPSVFTRYVALTLAIPLVPLALAVGCGVFAWRVRQGTSLADLRPTIDAVDFLAGLAPAGLFLYFVRPLRGLRRKQRRAFVELRRLARLPREPDTGADRPF